MLIDKLRLLAAHKRLGKKKNVFTKTNTFCFVSHSHKCTFVHAKRVKKKKSKETNRAYKLQLQCLYFGTIINRLHY